MKNEATCCLWVTALDEDQPSPDLLSRLQSCDECRAQLQRRAMWETALRQYANEVSREFRWSPTAQESAELEFVAPLSRLDRYRSLRLFAVAATLVFACWMLKEAETILQSRTDSGDQLAVSAAGTDRHEPIASLKPQPARNNLPAHQTRTAVIPMVRSVYSSSHVTMPTPQADDELVFVMLYPRMPHPNDDAAPNEQTF